MRSTRAVVLFVLLVMLLAACGGQDAAESTDAVDAAGEGAVDAPDQAAEGDDGAVTREETGLTAGGGEAGVGTVADDEAAEDPDAAQAPEIEPLPDPPPAAPGDRIIKEGTVSIEVEEDQFDRAYLAVVSAARRHGGDVVGSTTHTGDNGDVFGSVTVRVPVANFEDLVVGVTEIGTVQQRNVDSQDVSAEFTDLESRLRHLKAQERFYLGLFDQAESVQDAISVQQQLDGIQNQIEQVEGRLRLLDDRTSFSTLTVELFEPGAGGPLLREESPENGQRPSLARYWDTARDAFVNVVGAILVALLFAAPLLIMVAASLALWMVLRRHTPGPRRAQPEPEDDVVEVSS